MKYRRNLKCIKLVVIKTTVYNVMRFAYIYRVEIKKSKVEGKNQESTKIVSEYDQEIPQSQTADNPMVP